jgi:glycosyltransferase involved in cell wall biosynthesis
MRERFSTVAIATHYLASGPALELEDYLRVRTNILLFIAHPLEAGHGPAYWRLYREGRLVRQAERVGAHGPMRYLREISWTVRWSKMVGERFDLFVGGDNLMTLAGLWLRRRRGVRWVVLYSIDFVPQRFRNRLLNRAYHAVDAFAARHADVVWSVSSEIEAARQRRDGGDRRAAQLVVPVGAHIDRIERRALRSVAAHRIVFMGHLLEKQGVQLAIEAMPAIRQAIPDATFLVVGDGPYAARLHDLAHKHGVSEAVEFRGYVEDHRRVEELLATSALAIAPYTPDPTSFTRFADPGKIKVYMACGLPVVLTDVAAIGPWLESEGAGTVINYTVDSLAGAIVSYLRDPKSLERARERAAELAAGFSWDAIFEDALRRTEELVRQ